MILLLPLLCVATTTETVACEPNRQDKKAQPCWIDQPDLLYSWLLDIPLREPEITDQLPRYTPKIQLPPEPVIVQFPEPPATDHKPAITPQNSEPANPGKRTLPRLWLQIDADLIDMNEADLIITQIAQAQKPNLLKGGTGWQLLHTAGTDWATRHRTIWEMPLTPTEISSAFQGQIDIEMQCLCAPHSAPQMFSGAGTMWFSPAFQEGGISDIRLHSGTGTQMNGEMTFLTDEAHTGLFLDREAFLSFEQGDDLESWQASIAFLFQDHDSITTVNGAFTGIRENEAAALIGYFFSDPE